MTDAKMRQQVVDLQRKLSAAEAAQTRAISDLTVIRSVLGANSRSLTADVTALLNYASQAKQMQARFADIIAQLRAVQSVEEARAIGNSMDALFRATPVPEVLAGR
jgi:hypothetical protein